MTKPSIITLGRFVICSLISLIIVSCSKNTDMVIGDYGYYLLFKHRPTERIIVFDESDLQHFDNLSCLDLHVLVTSEFREQIGYTIPQPYYIEGEKGIEQQIKDYLDPNGDKYNGSMPVIVEYRTEGCRQIHFSLYDNDDAFLTDLTDMARFHYVIGITSWDEDGMNLLIDTSKKLLGKIAIGSTIQEYLAYSPMVFAEARFIFPELEKSALDEGKYIRIEIELDDGRILTANSKDAI